uniref:Uncharacterized protein n=1 Tax=Candidatus Kentrum sp. LFY TaxID=2126342 RepID=A0A450W6L9_9GAMM|nr:MAG: hypothetical protein BECKLFY1418C_GA0070996_100157 [Candidatus Kentron sp. LFY]
MPQDHRQEETAQPNHRSGRHPFDWITAPPAGPPPSRAAKIKTPAKPTTPPEIPCHRTIARKKQPSRTTVRDGIPSIGLRPPGRTAALQGGKNRNPSQPTAPPEIPCQDHRSGRHPFDWITPPPDGPSPSRAAKIKPQPPRHPQRSRATEPSPGKNSPAGPPFGTASLRLDYGPPAGPPPSRAAPRDQPFHQRMTIRNSFRRLSIHVVSRQCKYRYTKIAQSSLCSDSDSATWNHAKGDGTKRKASKFPGKTEPREVVRSI